MVVTKEERTQLRILDEAARLFNQKGYAGTAISDIMEATGLAKGGIYGKFGTKGELEVAAFDHAVAVTASAIRDALAGETTAPGKLHTLLRFYERFLFDPPVRGGCMIMNASIEADDANPRLRGRVVHAMDGWVGFLTRVIREGIRQGEIRKGIDPATYASLFFATLSGGLMMAKAYGDQRKLTIALDHLHGLIDRELAARET